MSYNDYPPILYWASRGKQLDNAIQQVNGYKAKLDLWCTKLEEEERDVAVRTNALNQWEAQLKEKMAELEKREAALAERENEGRQQAIAQLAAIDETAGGINQQIQAAVLAIRGLVEPLKEVRDTCTGSFSVPGLRELCRVAGEMHRAEDDSIRYYADEIDGVLAHLGCTKIMPRQNQRMNLSEMVPLDAEQRGTFVDQVCEAGWKLNETVLKKAIVTVKEI
jgi:DNA-binding transcriptional MerR regulator